MKDMTYEEAVNRLGEIVNILEKNEVSLEESVKLFQEGVELSQYCDKKLESISSQVARIYENGELKNFNGDE